MKSLYNLLQRVKPHFQPGGKLSALGSVYEGFESFLFTPSTTAPRSGAVHIHDSHDSKRAMIIVVLALLPCFFFGMYNTGYQHWKAAGAVDFPFWELMAYGFLAVLPRVVLTYVVGLGIEFIAAQIKKEEIQEGFLVTGLLIPMICPIETPLWMLAVATAFAVIFAKEVFGGTGYNIFNVALVARAFLFFAYPAAMSGDKVFVASGSVCGLGAGVDAVTCATPLGAVATGTPVSDLSAWDAFVGLIPGSFGETSVICILIGAAVLLLSGIGSWRIMLSAVVGTLAMGWIAHTFATDLYPGSMFTAVDHLLYGGLAFAIVFMATDPVTACHTPLGKLIYGFLIGVVAVLIRVYNNGYPEGAMLAVLLLNAFASLIDFCVVRANIARRRARLTSKK